MKERIAKEFPRLSTQIRNSKTIQSNQINQKHQLRHQKGSKAPLNTQVKLKTELDSCYIHHIELFDSRSDKNFISPIVLTVIKTNH